jgi:hypothetical protein
MTFNDWLQLEAFIAANWQNAKLQTKRDAELRHQVVADLDHAPALAALTAMVRSGREFPPNPGQLYATVAEASRPPAPAPGTILALLTQAAGTYGAQRELEAVRWLAAQSPHAARFAVEHGWTQFCREGLFDPEFGGAVRQRLERSAQSCAAGLEREHREGRVLPLVADHVARLESGLQHRTGLRHLSIAGVMPPPPALPATTERDAA